MKSQDKIAIYPGSFDPITLGHVDVIERSSKIFDKVIVVVAVNSKKLPLFDDLDRKKMVEVSLSHLSNVEVEISKELMVSFARMRNANTLIRGIRAISDFEYEFQIALMNKKLEPSLDTVFLMPDEKYTYLNSSIIRELARYDQDISEFVNPYVMNMLKEKFAL